MVIFQTKQPVLSVLGELWHCGHTSESFPQRTVNYSGIFFLGGKGVFLGVSSMFPCAGQMWWHLLRMMVATRKEESLKQPPSCLQHCFVE